MSGEDTMSDAPRCWRCGMPYHEHQDCIDVLNAYVDQLLEYRCAVKHCDGDADTGQTWVLGGLRVELDLCLRHFDELDRDAERTP